MAWHTLLGTSTGEILATAAGMLGTGGIVYGATRLYDFYRRAIVDRKSDRKEMADYWQARVADQDLKLDKVEREIEELRQEHVKCLIENETLNGRIVLLQQSVDNLRSGMDPVFLGELNPVACIVHDQDGVITVASPFVVTLLHFTERELIGRNVKKVIPPRYHARHDEKVRAVVETGVPPDKRQVLSLSGQTKQGEEVPIYIRHKAWQDGGKWMFAAYIQEREDTPVSSDAIPTYVSEPGIGPVPVPVRVVNPPEQPVPAQIAPPPAPKEPPPP